MSVGVVPVWWCGDDDILRRQFHIMRDHPLHNEAILAGLWGGHNYHNLRYRILTPHPQLSLISHNLSLAAQLRQALFSRPASADYTSDQRALREAVWPVAR